MQMSRAGVFIFIEGPNERFIYSKFAECELCTSGIEYQVVTPEELQQSGSGKQSLLKFHDYLRNKCSLLDNFQNKKTVSIFFLDKDVDDFKRKLRRSKHVIYTTTYEIENYLFLYGEIVEAAAAAASLDVSSVRHHIGDDVAWLKRATLLWKEWVVVCLYGHTKIPPRTQTKYYGRPCSQINDSSPYDSVNPTKHQSFVAELRNLSGLDSATFQKSFERLKKKVEKIYSTQKQDTIFKGKWYFRFLIEDVNQIAGPKSIKTKALHDKLFSTLAQTLDFQKEWTEHFRKPIREVISYL